MVLAQKPSQEFDLHAFYFLKNAIWLFLLTD